MVPRIFHAIHWTLTLCGFFFVVAMIGTSSTLAQRCVAQGDGSRDGWGPCGARTITVWIEQPPVYILGPPQVVWIRPSAAGAGQSPLVIIDNPVLVRELANNSVTGWQFYRKGVTALNEGDIKKAKAYCEAALQRQNRSDELEEIQATCNRIRLQADRESGMPTPMYQKSVRTTMELEVDEVERWFESTDAKYDPVRRELLPLLLLRSNARQKAGAANEEIAKAKARQNSLALAKANEEMAKAKAELEKAEKAVLDKNKEAEITFRLVK